MPSPIGVTSMTGPLTRVAMRRPGAILHADPERWHYAGPISPGRLVEQFGAFVGVLGDHGVEIDWLPDQADDLADSIFTYDPSYVIGDGAVLLRPGKDLRLGEIDLHRRFYDAIGVPILGAIDPPGVIEGGDIFHLDETTLAVGRGFRTNTDGIGQFRAIVERYGLTVESWDLPYHGGPDACLHLLSLISPLAPDLAIVHETLLPAALHERLTAAGWTLVAAPPHEFTASGGLSLNVLATAPRRLIAIDGHPDTVDRLVDAGCEVDTFLADALCIPCEGGPTCLTRPLHRR